MIKKLFSLATLMLLAAACTDHIDFPANIFQRQAPIFHAIIEDGENAGSTKVFADEQMRVLWNKNDNISLFNKNTGNLRYGFKGEDGDNAGDFQYVSGTETSTTVDHTLAVYPYSEATILNGDGVVSLILPASQTYKEHSFGIGANTMVSVTSDDKLMFRNVGGYLSFKLFGENISVKSITLKGNNGEKIAGAATVTMPVDGTPTVQMKSNATESVTLTCEQPVALGASADDFIEFWFVLPPTDFAGGFTITVTDALGGSFQKETSNPISITRNNLSRMKPVEVVPNYDIVFVPFEDANFKTYCLEKFDTDHDGRISIPDEADEVTSIDINTDNISSLQGIEYFPNLKSLNCRGTINNGSLTRLDVSNNPALTFLDCSANQLTSLDVSKNTALTVLDCSSNPLLKDIWLKEGQVIGTLSYDSDIATIHYYTNVNNPLNNVGTEGTRDVLLR